MTGRFRKRPVEVEAWQYGGPLVPPSWIEEAALTGVISSMATTGMPPAHFMHIQTLEGVMRADLGDWIVRGVKGELYPVKPAIFEATYEPVAPAKGEAQ